MLMTKARQALSQLNADERATLRSRTPETARKTMLGPNDAGLVNLRLIERRAGGVVLTPLGKVVVRLLGNEPT